MCFRLRSLVSFVSITSDTVLRFKSQYFSIGAMNLLEQSLYALTCHLFHFQVLNNATSESFSKLKLVSVSLIFHFVLTFTKLCMNSVLFPPKLATNFGGKRTEFLGYSKAFIVVNVAWTDNFCLAAKVSGHLVRWL